MPRLFALFAESSAMHWPKRTWAEHACDCSMAHPCFWGNCWGQACAGQFSAPGFRRNRTGSGMLVLPQQKAAKNGVRDASQSEPPMLLLGSVVVAGCLPRQRPLSQAAFSKSILHPAPGWPVLQRLPAANLLYRLQSSAFVSLWGGSNQPSVPPPPSQAAHMGRAHETLVHCRPDDSLKAVAQTLYEAKHSMAPILSSDPDSSIDGEIPNLLHVATISGVLACLLRHFRASLSSLPLLSHPLGSLPLGSWASADLLDSENDTLEGDPSASGDSEKGNAAPPHSLRNLCQNHSCCNRLLFCSRPRQGRAPSSSTLSALCTNHHNPPLDAGTRSLDSSPVSCSRMHGPAGSKRIGPLHTISMDTPLTTALQLLLERGVSSLPVVDENGALLDVYSRADITMLVRPLLP